MNIRCALSAGIKKQMIFYVYLEDIIINYYIIIILFIISSKVRNVERVSWVL